MHERRYNGGIERLRTPERIALLEAKRVIELSLEKLDAQNVLDVGTGSGLFAEEFAKHGLYVTGIDASNEMVEAARKHIPSGHFEKAIAEQIPFPDNSFDLVFLGVVLHETDDLSKALKEVHRVVRKRAAILEWPYSQAEYGPPLEHRIKPELFDSLIQQCGFKGYEKISLKNLELYLLRV
jgi:ubiquinone/menaquinone biosynthesis C-methylase UbiE